MTLASEIVRSVGRHLNEYSVKFSNQLEWWNKSYSSISSMGTIVQIEYDSPIYMCHQAMIKS